MGQGTESLISQVQALLNGQLVIPSIQRGYVWQRSQVPYLLDSLYRGYPVGALLVWKTTLDVPLRTAAITQSTPAYVHPAVLLDGQQRLTSLAKVVVPDAITGSPLDVRFDLRTQDFLNPSAVQRRDQLLVPVANALQESPQFVEILRNAGVSPDDTEFDVYYERLKRVHGIRKYAMPIITVDSDDYEEVAEIFARVNQGGRRLSKGDLVYSAIAARWPDGLDTIEAFNSELDKRNFALDREAVLRLMGLMAGVGAHAIKLIAKEMTAERLKDAWAETEDALRRVVDFLANDCKIPRSAVLTSPNIAVVPAYLLHHRKGQLADSEVALLRRWVYTAMAFSHYSNQVEGKLDIEARLTHRETDEIFPELLRRASGPRSVDSPIAPDDLTGKTANSPLFNLLYIAALRGNAKDWCANTAISAEPMSSGSAIEYHHVFPKARVQGRYGPARTNDLANLAFISGSCNRKIGAKRPADYLVELHRDRLTEQWIPGDSTLWELDEFEKFLAARREAQARALNELLGLPLYTSGRVHGLEGEVPNDEDVIDGVENQSGQ
ncbi:MAG: GmrSD restriction endonuclease domain-containing protein [Pseudonocardiaceae bacterium]